MKLWGKYSGAGVLICTVDLTRGDQQMKFDPIGNGGGQGKELIEFISKHRIKKEKDDRAIRMEFDGAEGFMKFNV